MRFFCKYFIFSSFSVLATMAFSQSYKSAETTAYINRFSAIAVKDMKEYKIPASITLAQGILESGSGRSALAKKANNHFGIKCGGDYSGKKYYKDDDKRNDCFRVYENADESYRDHSIFLTTRKHYAPLFDLKITDYKSWAKGLKKCGYATNPKYPDLLIAVIEQNELYKYDTYSEPEKDVEDNKPVNNTTEVIVPNPVVNDGKINGVSCIEVKPGETFYALSKRHNISIKNLMDYNDFTENYILKAGEYIFLNKKKKKYDGEKFHIFKKGETLHSISQKYGIRLKNLKKLNKIETEPNVGSKLILN